MAQKYGKNANKYGGGVEKCVGCKKENPDFTWSDIPGEGMCTNCGMSYILKPTNFYDGEDVPQVSVPDNYVEIFREWYQENEKLAYLGGIIVPEQYQEGLVGRREFFGYVEENYPEMMEEK